MSKIKYGWTCIDLDRQYMRCDGDWFEMIQITWLDTTKEDRLEGEHEYCIERGSIHLSNYSEDEQESAIAVHGYTLDELRRECRQEVVEQLIVEWILEDAISCDACIIGEADSFEEAQRFVKELIEKESAEE